MKMLRRCMECLGEHHIRYSHSIHPPAYTAREVASADRMPAHNLAKAVVYFADNGYGMVVVPADYSVDFTEVRRLLGSKQILLATETELAELFPECEVGAMPPLGNLFHMPVIVDESIAASEFIAFTAGTHRDVIHMGFGDFRRLVKPLVAAVAVKESVGA
jgi:Ala-tRNA(Pro) deacylase